jgi:hypothetical protein
MVKQNGDPRHRLGGFGGAESAATKSNQAHALGVLARGGLV